MAESEELKSLLVEMKEDSEKAGLKLNIPKTKRKVETVTDFIFLGSKITVDGGPAMKLKDFCSLEKRNHKHRQHIKKQRHYFADKVCLVRAMVFFQWACMDVRVEP